MTIHVLIDALLVAIPVSAIPRAMYCVYKWKSDEEQGSLFKRRLVNLLIFVAIAEGVSAFLYTVYHYIY